MKLLMFGLILAVLGAIAIAVPSITFFTKERVADLGFFTFDISRPHTLFFNPVVGGALLAVGAVLAILGLRKSAP